MARRLRHFGPGGYWFVTDRCHEERHLLRPDPVACELVAAAISDTVASATSAAERVAVLAFSVMGNHWHFVLRAGDEPSSIPRFMQRLKSNAARALNLHRGRKGVFWTERYHAIPILDEASLLDRITYVLMNPVAAGLASRIDEYPGLTSCEANLGVRGVCRHDVPIAVLPSWEGLSSAELARKRAWLLGEVRSREAAVKAERIESGRGRPRPERCVRVDPFARPERPARGRPPSCFASTRTVRNAFATTWRGFVAAYRAASSAFRGGVLDALFPPWCFPPRLEHPPNPAR